jgi:hypothetical protein
MAIPFDIGIDLMIRGHIDHGAARLSARSVSTVARWRR